MKLNLQLREEIKKIVKAKLKEVSRRVFVTSSCKMSPEDKKNLQKALPQLSTRQFVYSVDPSLIAGLVLRFDSKIVDLSLRGELQKLRTTLYDIT